MSKQTKTVHDVDYVYLLEILPNCMKLLREQSNSNNECEKVELDLKTNIP